MFSDDIHKGDKRMKKNPEVKKYLTAWLVTLAAMIFMRLLSFGISARLGSLILSHAGLSDGVRRSREAAAILLGNAASDSSCILMLLIGLWGLKKEIPAYLYAVSTVCFWGIQYIIFLVISWLFPTAPAAVNMRTEIILSAILYRWTIGVFFTVLILYAVKGIVRITEKNKK